MKVKKEKIYTCGYCQTKYPNKTKKCPNCRAKTPRSKLPMIIVIFVLCIFGATIIGSKFTLSDINSDILEKKKNLNLEKGYTTYLSEDGKEYVIKGIVTNNSSRDYSSMMIKFLAYDNLNEIISTCIGEGGKLQANSKWKFKATCITNPNKIVKIKFLEITAN